MGQYQAFKDTLQDLRHIFHLLPPALRRRGIFLALSMVPLAFLELGSAGVVSLLAAALSDPQRVMNIPLIAHCLSFTPVFASSLPPVNFFLILLGCGLAVVIIIKNGVQAYLFWKTAVFTELATNSLGTLLTQVILGKPYLWYTQQKTADMLNWIAWRMGALNFLSSVATLLTYAAILLILIMGISFVEPELFFIMVTVLGLCALLMFHKMRSTIRQKSTQALHFAVVASRSNLAMLQGFVEVALYGQRHAFLQDFYKNDRQAALLRADTTTLGASSPWILESLSFILLAGVICFMILGKEASQARIIGTLALFGAASWRILPSVHKCMQSCFSIVTYRPYLAPYLELISSYTSHENSFPEEHEPALRLREQIVFDDVTLLYPESSAPALHHISLHIHKGEMVGFVGRSGAGKSTLVGLLTGLLAPNSGTICIDTTVLSLKTVSPWGKSIGYVPQSAYIMDATLAENIAFSDWGKQIDLDRVKEVCCMASIDFLHQLPQGLDTPLGEQGIRLSGGQAQRVVIARALYHNPDVIIFDEATSALDTATEKSIQNVIDNLKGQLTVVLIAHRLSTVEKCDRIFWLENGAVKKEGTASEILSEYQQTMT